MSVAIENGDGTYNPIAGKAFGVAKFGEPRTNWLTGHTSAATAITADCDGILIAKFNSSNNTSSVEIHEDIIVVFNQDQYGPGSQTYTNACIPIRKGHKYYWNGNGHTLNFSFFYPFIENIVTPIESKDIYSTTETVVGQWIDGKPIYRRFLLRKENSRGMDLTSLNIDNIIKIDNLIGDNANIYFSNISYDNNLVFYLTKTQLVFRYSRYVHHIILEYTKTTD